MTTKNLLVELFVEELPPKALKKLGDAFAKEIYATLRKLDYLETNSTKTVFASPRRLGVHITDVRDYCPDVPVRTRLLPVSVAYPDDGMPSPSLLKRLEKEEASLNEVKRAFEGGKEFVFLERLAAGRPLIDGLQGALLVAIENLPIPKVMGYQLADGWSTVNFVRPAHGLVALHGSEVVPVSVLGLTSGNTTQGHRFEAVNSVVTLKSADSYAEQLETEGAVIASFAARRAEIVRQLEAAAAAQGLKPIEDDALLDEVTGLVERPNVLLGQFEEAFLEVPQECLILTMKANQKYFPLLDAQGKLTNRFLIVSNINPADPSLVIGGNERVVRPRLADAKFFFDQDRKKTLESRVLGLAKVVYHNKLGTQGERVQRVCAIARAFGQQLGGDSLAMQAEQAALLAKADLLTDMVGEFPELQGIMGRYYAQHDGLPDAIAYAIEDHYKPRFAGDELPRNPVGICVALADKLETLVGMFRIGSKPTGDKDPFALRRHALGVIRLLIEHDLSLNIEGLFQEAASTFNSIGFDEIKRRLAEANSLQSAHVTVVERQIDLSPSSPMHGWREDLRNFFLDRLAGVLREQSYTAHEIDAVLSFYPSRLNDIVERLIAVRNFASLQESAALAAANKRVGNILKKVESEISGTVNTGLLHEAAEHALYAALGEIAPQANAAFERGDYTASLQALAALRAPVDAFFDSVMVNADDPALRANRLALLAQLHAAMNRVADLSKLAA